MILELLRAHSITPKHVAGTHGGEYASPCPDCGGRDRFRCWPEQGEHGSWYCRGCEKAGDAIEFLRQFDGLSFKEACERLGVKSEYKPRPLAVPKAQSAEAFTPKIHDAPAELWQTHAGKLMLHAHNALLDNAAELAKLAARGLPLPAVARFRLGWLPGEQSTGRHGQVKIRDCYFRARSAWGLPPMQDKNGKEKRLWIPRGLVIPAFGQDEQVSRLRIRRTEADRERFLPEMKFALIPGSAMAPLLIAPISYATGQPLPPPHAYVITESEMDAMACAYAASRADLPVGALAVGTNLGKPDATAHAALESAAAILVALDFDEPDEKGKRPGAQGWPWWQAQYRQAIRWPVPVGKDPGEAVGQGLDLAVWIRAGLPGEMLLIHGYKSAAVAATEQKPIAMPTPSQGIPEGPAQEHLATSQEATPENAMPVGPLPVGKQSLGRAAEEESRYPWEVTGAMTNPAHPASALGHAVGAGAALSSLRWAGLQVTSTPAGYALQGHEQWPARDRKYLDLWLSDYDARIRADLVRQEALAYE